MKQLNWYQIFGKSNIPDGRTVLPTDDIQIWLHCANIWDKSYTTLAEVLADTDTLLALISSNNAVDYMVRSTTWAESVALVPTMTSNTTPSGVASASSVYADRASDQPYHALDGSNSYAWTPNTGSNTNYLQYAFEDTKSFYKFSITTNNKYTDEAKVDTLTVSIGETEGTLTDVYSYNPNQVAFSKTDTFTPTSGKICRVTFAQSQGYKYCSVPFLQFYSASITADATAMTYIGQNNYCADTLLADATWCNAICNSEYWNSVLNASVPAMTSNTTPSGTASTDSIYNTNYDAWKAFNGIDNINYGWCPADSGSHWVQYDFETPVCVKKIQYRGFTYGTGVNAVLRGSTDNVTFTNIFNIPNPGSATNNIMSADIFSNNDKYRYIRVNHVGSNGSGYRFQFYGREDV